MNEGSQNTELLNEFLRKLGRNVLNFQKLEFCLKILVQPNLTGSAETLAKQMAKQRESIRKSSMGILAGRLVESINKEDSNFPPKQDLQELWMSISFKIHMDPEAREELASELAAIVSERNDLIHLKLATLNTNSPLDCKELMIFLDDQNKRITPVLEKLGELAWSFSTIRAYIAENAELLISNINDNESGSV